MSKFNKKQWEAYHRVGRPCPPFGDAGKPPHWYGEGDIRPHQPAMDAEWKRWELGWDIVCRIGGVAFGVAIWLLMCYWMGLWPWS